MKKLTNLLMALILLLSCILSACTGDGTVETTPDEPITSDNSAEDTSSETPESSVPAESSEESSQTDESLENSESSETDTSVEEGISPTVTHEDEKYYLKNEDYENIVKKGNNRHDYCTCGMEIYNSQCGAYQGNFEVVSGVFVRFVDDNGIVTREEIDAYLRTLDNENKNDGTAYKRYDEKLPWIYCIIKHFNITKEEYLEYREYAIENGKYYIGANVFTDRQIEIVFGNYDKETVMRELKSDLALYHDGKIYTYEKLKNLNRSDVADELKKLVQVDEFYLWLYDLEMYICNNYEKKHYERDKFEEFCEYIETLRAEMEAQ